MAGTRAGCFWRWKPVVECALWSYKYRTRCECCPYLRVCGPRQAGAGGDEGHVGPRELYALWNEDPP